MTTASARVVAAMLALTAYTTAALAGGECAAPAQRAYFASGAFYRGDGATDLVGNAFVILANAGPLCDEPTASPDCAPHDNRRAWHTQMVTAAHVVTELCEAKPDKAEHWSPGRLILNPDYAFEYTRSVELVLDEDWCTANKAAGARLGGKAVAIDSHKAGTEALDRENVDLWLFAATFLLPRRALISPYTLSLLPRHAGPDVRVRGFSPVAAGTFTRKTLGSHPVVWGSGKAELPELDKVESKYQIKTEALHGQSGSPVGFFPDDGPQSVFGVLTETATTTCTKIEDDQRQELVKKLVAAGLSPDAADDDRVRNACYQDETARKHMHEADETAFFVPLVRNPRLIREAYDSQVKAGGLVSESLRARIDARVDAALSLYADPDRPRPQYFDEALSLIMQGLTTIQQIVVIEQIKARSKPPLNEAEVDLLGKKMCDHLEP